MRRVAVVGTSGSGKTTFSKRLAARLGLPRIELDAFHWEPGWTEADPATFRARAEAATATDRWVCDGNYSVVRDLVLDRTDTVVWLDLPLRTCLRRVIARTIRRGLSREELWGTGNRESVRRLFTRDSLAWWVLTTHSDRRGRYEALFAEPAFSDVAVLRFRTSREAEAWLAAVPIDGSWRGRGSG